MVLAIFALLAACAGPKETAVKWPTLDGKPPLIIAHRGASGYLPEHTLEAYALAIEQGADVVEPDLVFTKDGVLVARHDRYLSTTTNVADKPEFASRKRANSDPKTPAREDWWIEDFTLGELKTLRARQPFPGRTKDYDDQFEIPTFAEMLALVAAKSKEAGRSVGVYPETKHPAFFASIGHDFEAPLLKALGGFDAGPVFIQSFEPEILKRLKGKTDAKLVQLVFEETPEVGPNVPLTEIATYADGVGASKDLVVGAGGVESRFLAVAKAQRLFVHVWTIRDDRPNLPLTYLLQRNSAAPPAPKAGNDAGTSSLLRLGPYFQLSTEGEIEYFFQRGADGVFVDFPDTGVRVLRAPTWAIAD
jgi:glycerophosphoryl diester phosphodiesterase